MPSLQSSKVNLEDGQPLNRLEDVSTISV